MYSISKKDFHWITEKTEVNALQQMIRQRPLINAYSFRPKWAEFARVCVCARATERVCLLECMCQCVMVFLFSSVWRLKRSSLFRLISFLVDKIIFYFCNNNLRLQNNFITAVAVKTNTKYIFIA